MFSSAGFAKTWQYIDLFRQGLVCTISLSLFTVIFGFVLALVLALMRLSRFRVLKTVAAAYVELFRATPMLVQLFVVYYVLLGGLSLPTVKLFGFIRF